MKLVSIENNFEIEMAVVNVITVKMEKLCNPNFSSDFTSYDETANEVNKLKNKTATQKQIFL